MSMLTYFLVTRVETPVFTQICQHAPVLVVAPDLDRSGLRSIHLPMLLDLDQDWPDLDETGAKLSRSETDLYDFFRTVIFLGAYSSIRKMRLALSICSSH